MPALGKNSKSGGQTKISAKAKSKKKTTTKVPVTEKEAPKKKKKKQEQVKEVHPEQTAVPPFSDGVVSAKFCTVPSVLHAGGPEVEMLRAAMHYFTVTEPFIGTINTKVSFMKKKGGRLL